MREARSTHSKGGDKLVRREGEGQVFVEMGSIPTQFKMGTLELGINFSLMVDMKI